MIIKIQTLCISLYVNFTTVLKSQEIVKIKTVTIIFLNLTDILMRKATTRKTRNSNCWWGYGATGTLILHGRNVIVLTIWKLALKIPANKWMPSLWPSNYTSRYMPKEIHAKRYVPECSQQ